MRTILLACLSFLIPGCTTSVRVGVPAGETRQQKEVRDALAGIFEAAKQKDFARLEEYHLYGPMFTKFDISETSSREDASTARERERSGIAPLQDLRMEARDLKIDVFGDVAVATFIFDCGFRNGAAMVNKSARSTLVFVKNGGRWKITHEHHSLFKPVQ